MARPREFDTDAALDAAIGVFRERGFAGSSAGDLTRAMGIGRQSLYDTFGDKAQLYRAALARYTALETEAHLAALSTGPRAIDGLEIVLARVRAKAGEPCLGVGSICEFGRTRADLTAIHAGAERALLAALMARLRTAQGEGDVSAELDVREGAAFLVASLSGIRIAARGGAGAVQLQALAELALRALR
ncbi:MAG: TetR/AcrR family transcriptional regulator [Hyphomonas sp.]|nr:TetR/AcrR family transcriptional regulator [Hyphomonas sp.]